MGPYTAGSQARNVRKAIEMANVISELGGCPFVPHLCHFWELLYPHDYDFWMDYDIQWLEICDAAFRMPGESKGADAEYARCGKLKIPVFSSTVDLIKFIDDWRYNRGYYSA